MTKKNVGLAKNQRIRIHDDDLVELNSVVRELKLPAKNNKPGDAVHVLILLYRGKKIEGNPFLVEREIPHLKEEISNLKSILDDRQGTMQKQKKMIDYLCGQTGNTYGEIVQIVK